MLLYGAVDSPVWESMVRTRGSGSFSKGQSVRSGDIVALDGDAMSPTQLAADSEVDRILAAGASVLLVDGKEAHHEGMHSATRAGGTVGGESHATLFAPFRYAGGRQGVYILDLAAGERKTKKKKTVHRKTGIVQGEIAQTTVPRRLSAVSMERFALRAKALSDGTWTDPFAASVPPEVAWMSVPFELIEQADDAALNGQSISEDVTFIFRGFYAPAAEGGFLANAILVEHDGTIETGTQTVETVTPVGDGFLQAVVGWFQTSSLVSVTPDRSNPSGQSVLPGVANMTVTGDSYQGLLENYISYYDASGATQTWNPFWTVPATPLTVPGWTLQTSGDDPTFFYYQQSPFDASLGSPNYSDAIDPNQIGAFLALPDASNRTLPISGCSVFSTSDRIDGPVRFNLRVGRTYTELLTEFAESPPITAGAGGTTFEEDGNRAFVIDLGLCQPAGGLGISKNK
ncbi:hypothetical protein EON81_03835 [bacterium]|nr:MAG: hypothetical protein EON81_03835 [bacterium]